LFWIRLLTTTIVSDWTRMKYLTPQAILNSAKSLYSGHLSYVELYISRKNCYRNTTGHVWLKKKRVLANNFSDESWDQRILKYLNFLKNYSELCYYWISQNILIYKMFYRSFVVKACSPGNRGNFLVPESRDKNCRSTGISVLTFYSFFKENV
jgi:hypothetical protein